MFRIVELSRRGIALSLRDECLVVTHNDRSDDSAPAVFPLAELSAVLITDPALTISGAVLYALAGHHIPLVACDRKAMPVGLLKVLTVCGFSAVQKSVAWRWCEDAEQCGNIIAKVRRGRAMKEGDLLFFSIPDEAFRRTVHLAGEELLVPPAPPDPWCIFA